jgi:hypothetical protein
MSVDHAISPFPKHFGEHPCKRCKAAPATQYVHARRKSRSGNYRRFTVGAYCRGCADLVIAEARRRERDRKDAPAAGRGERRE